MDARAPFACARRRVIAWLAVAALVVLAPNAHAAAYRTKNFVVQAPTRALAAEIGQSAEAWRKKLALEWLGKEMPAWSKPCPIKARVAPNLGAGGATSFMFDRGEVYGWEMEVQGSRQRVLDSVLPHEITHTVFATHFRQPLPRWADEGACTTVEHKSEVGKQERMLIRFLKTGKGIPFSRMFAMKEYPPEVMPLYSQGHSVATFLIERRGKAAFLEFLEDGMEDENWPAAVREHYGHASLLDLQVKWLDWVKAGRPRLARETGPTVVAQADAPSRITGASRAGDQPSGSALAAVERRDQEESVYASMGRSAGQGSKPVTPQESAYDASRATGTVWR